MWPFTCLKKMSCHHTWHVTEVAHFIRRHDDPAHLYSESKGSNVYRICRNCLSQECHQVEGHLEKDEAFIIFGS